MPPTKPGAVAFYKHTPDEENDNIEWKVALGRSGGKEKTYSGRVSSSRCQTKDVVRPRIYPHSH